MIISAVKILELNEEHKLIENLCERELKDPEGVSIDIRVGEVNKIISDSYLASDEGSRERYSPKTEVVGDVSKDGNKKITIRPGEFYLVTTMEIIHSPEEKIKFDSNMPEGYLVPKIAPRSSLQRGGVILMHTWTNPGYKGKLTFGIKNVGDQDFHFDLGARMFSVEYHSVVGDMDRAYSGQHQGGRVTSGGESEVQN